MCFRRLCGAARLSLLLWLTSFAGSAEAGICNRVNQPGATLLFPYFEVDLSDPEGRTADAEQFGPAFRGRPFTSRST